MLRNASYDFSSGSVDQPGQLLEVFGDVPGVGRSLARCGNQHGALDGVANGDHRSDRRTYLFIGRCRGWRLPPGGSVGRGLHQ